MAFVAERTGFAVVVNGKHSVALYVSRGQNISGPNAVEFYDDQDSVVNRMAVLGAEYETVEIAPPTYATATAARKAMVRWIDGITAQIFDQYPRAIQARWVVEEAAARAVKAGTADADQLALVTDEGASKGRTPEEHADAIVANADAFRAISAEINKLFLATDAALQAETDPFQYEAILEAAKAQAAPLAEIYGLDVS